MNGSGRARSAGAPGDRARRAYARLCGDDDPAGDWLAAGALDLRVPGSARPHGHHGAIVLAGPDDLVELRRIVEGQLGPGTWPMPDAAIGERRTVTVEVPRGAATGVVHALEGIIEQRSPWGGWRTVVDTMAARLDALDRVTLDAVRVEG